MAQFDPNLRRETWVFQKVSEDAGGRPYYRRMGFNLVEYDGSPDRYIEPVNVGYNVDLTDFDVATIDNTVLTQGAVVGFQFHEARPYEVHSFGDPVAT